MEHVPYVLSLFDCMHVVSGNVASLSTSRIWGPENDEEQLKRSQIICAPKGTWLDVRHLRLVGMGPLTGKYGTSLRWLLVQWPFRLLCELTLQVRGQ